MVDNQTINYIINLIEKRELVFFTGAGISLSSPSNLITFNHLQNKIIWALHHNLPRELKQVYKVIYNEIDKDKDKAKTTTKFMNIPPEYIFELCKKDIICKNEDKLHYELEPLNSFRNAKPNLNHLHLARFLLDGYIPAIFTTNFDMLIECGADELSRTMEYDIKINNRWKIEHFKNKKYSVGQYFKLHGCIEDFESIVMSLDEIGKRCTNQLPALKYYLENYHVFFIGYRGADLDIFSHLATIQCKGIIWNGYTEDAIIPKIKHLLKTQKAKVVIGDASAILNEISSKLGLPNLNLGEVKKELPKDFLGNFISWSNKIEPISKITILGEVWDYIGEWENALNFFYSGYHLAHKFYDKYTENLILNRLIAILYKSKKYKKMKKLCDLALENAKEFPEALQLYEYVHIFQLFGLVEGHSDLRKSLDFFQKALSYQEKLEKIAPTLKCKKADILLNVASGFRKANFLDNSINYCKNAIEIYDEFGNIQGRASTLACIGSILLEQEKYNDCLSYYEEAKYLFNETGNFFKLPKILHDIGVAYFKNNDKKNAQKYAEASLAYCEIISDQDGYNKTKKLIDMICLS